MKKITSILLLGAENIIALSIIRALGSVLPNAKIHTLSPSDKNKSVPERSRFITSRHYIRSWDDNFHYNLLQKIEETNADLVLPVCDEPVRKVAAIKHQLSEKVYLPPLPTPEVYYKLEMKDQMAELLAKGNFPHAKTWRFSNGEINDIKERDFPVLVKPIDGNSGLGIKKANTHEELNEITSTINKEKFIVQELIPGQDIGCSILAEDGDIKAYTIQKVLGNKGYGVATALRFIENKPIYEYTKKLVKITGYSGLAHLDFRLDDKDNKPKLIDFNARFWFSLLGSKAAGVDFTLLCCLSALGIPFNRPEYRQVTYYAGMNTLRYYFKNLFSPRNLFLNGSAVYTDLWDRIADPIPEFARYIK